MALEGVQERARGCVPQLQRTVIAARENAFAVARECDRANAILMSREAAQDCARRRVPHLQRAIAGTPCKDSHSVRRESDRIDLGLLEAADERAVVCTPKLHGAVETR